MRCSLAVIAEGYIQCQNAGDRAVHQGCQVLVTEKAKLCFKKGKILEFTIYTFIDLKKANYL